MENNNVSVTERNSVDKNDRGAFFAELYFANVEVDINITNEILYQVVKDYIFKYLHLEEVEAKTEDILSLCKTSTEMGYNATPDEIEEVDKPLVELTLSMVNTQNIISNIELGLDLEFPNDEIKDIYTIKEFSDYIYSKLIVKQKESKITIKSYYHENGKISKQDYYMEEVLQVLSKEFSEDGLLKAEVGFDDGEEYGCSKHFYDTGELYYMSYNCDGNKEFQEIEYYKNGNKRLEEDYVEGFMHGWSKTYNEKCELLSKDLYDEDILVERHIFKTGTVKFFDYTDELKEELYGNNWK